MGFEFIFNKNFLTVSIPGQQETFAHQDPRFRGGSNIRKIY
jgi:hypothetical protein